MLPRGKFDVLVQQCGSDRYYKTFFSWDQLIVMLFGIFSRCDSMSEVRDSMRALEGKLNYLNMDCAPAKSTAGDALRDRSEELFRLYYFALIAYFSSAFVGQPKKRGKFPGVLRLRFHDHHLVFRHYERRGAQPERRGEEDEERRAECAHAERRTCRHGRFRNHQRSQNARQEVPLALEPLEREYAGLRQGL